MKKPTDTWYAVRQLYSWAASLPKPDKPGIGDTPQLIAEKEALIASLKEEIKYLRGYMTEACQHPIDSLKEDGFSCSTWKPGVGRVYATGVTCQLCSAYFGNSNIKFDESKDDPW
jgi:hypothetical protein